MLELELDALMVTEGVASSRLRVVRVTSGSGPGSSMAVFASPRLRIVSVPSGGVQGVIEVPLTVSSSGASKLTLYSPLTKLPKRGEGMVM